MSDAATLAAVERALDAGDPDDVLRGVLDALHRDFRHAAIVFVEDGELAPGPSVGEPEEPVARLPVVYGDVTVAELRVAPAPADTALLERVAELISPHCLVGWDTGGEPWGQSG